MAYQETPTIAGPDVLINHVMTFAAANGWTVDRNNLVGGNRTATLHKAGVSDYVHLYNSDTTSVRMRLSVGYDAGATPALQPNVSGEHRTVLNAGPYPNTFFFASQDQVWLTVSIAASGEYRHLTFGRLDKAGAYDGGSYIDGTEWSTASFPGAFSQKHVPFQSNYASNTNYGYLRADITDDARVNWFHNIGGQSANTSLAYGEAGDNSSNPGTAAFLVDTADQNPFSGRSIFHVIPIYVKRTGSQTYFSLAGTIQDVRYGSLQKFEPEQEITIGTDVWKIFPVAAKRTLSGSSGSGPAASGNFGYAIKKVA